MSADKDVVIDLSGGGAPVIGEEVPELREGLDLPPGAVENADGSVSLTFDEPVTIAYRAMGGGAPVTEPFAGFTLRRLKGSEGRRLMSASASRASDLALSLCSGVSQAKLAVLYKAMQATDLTAARNVIAALLDLNREGVPECATTNDDGSIALPLLYPATDGEGEEHNELTFKKLRAEALIAMQNAKNALDTGLHRATGLTLKAAAGLIDDMDFADVMAAQRVIGFLSGIGRRTGG